MHQEVSFYGPYQFCFVFQVGYADIFTYFEEKEIERSCDFHKVTQVKAEKLEIKSFTDINLCQIKMFKYFHFP